MLVFWKAFSCSTLVTAYGMPLLANVGIKHAIFLIWSMVCWPNSKWLPTDTCLQSCYVFFPLQAYAQNKKVFLQPTRGCWPHLKPAIVLTAGPTARIVYVVYNQSSICVVKAAVQPPPPPPRVNGFVCSFKVDMGIW